MSSGYKVWFGMEWARNDEDILSTQLTISVYFRVLFLALQPNWAAICNCGYTQWTHKNVKFTLSPVRVKSQLVWRLQLPICKEPFTTHRFTSDLYANGFLCVDGYSTEILYFHWHWESDKAFSITENLELPQFFMSVPTTLECVDKYSMGKKLSPYLIFQPI